MTFLNHIGVAVSDLPRMRLLFSILGLKTAHEESVPEQGVNTHFLPLPLKQSQIELLEVTDPEGTVAQFIQKKGPGIHHLSFEVDSGQLEPVSEKLKAAGFRLIYDAPKKGAHNMSVNFIHPATAGGILIEIMELPKS
jgi:methylmalonyl-CoA epimerase